MAMELISPPILKAGDTVGIVAPARKLLPGELNPAIKIFESWGLRVTLGKHIYGQHHQYSGTDKERAYDFEQMIENPQVKAIICARGGYGTIRLLDYLNLRALQREPKWVVGYSDITVMHGILNSWYLMESIHGIMPINFPKDGNANGSTESLRRALFGEPLSYTVQATELNRNGFAYGELCGGNLSILYSLSGTDADINPTDRILFIEDLDEYLYHVDRMMMNLHRSGKLKSIVGLVVGGMTDMKDNTIPFGSDAYRIIRDISEQYKFPICFGFPSGHGDSNMALIMGRKATLKVDSQGSTLTFNPASCAI